MTPRPLTLRHVAERSDTLEEFGRHFQDWLHSVRTLTSRPRVEAAVREAPPRLARHFPEGKVADAWLAAYAEHTANTIGRAVPDWTAGRISPDPWFAVSAPDSRSRLAALRDSPAYYPPDSKKGSRLKLLAVLSIAAVGLVSSNVLN